MVLGIGLGGCFPLIMLLALDHLHDPVQAGTLNALMQGGGFMLAALAAWAMAGLHRLTGGFAAGWWMHVAVVSIVMALVAPLAPGGFAAAMRAPKRWRRGGISAWVQAAGATRFQASYRSSSAGSRTRSSASGISRRSSGRPISM